MPEMRILVTGGAGFVGSNLAMALKRTLPDAEIVCMDNLYRRGSELNLARLKGNQIHFHYGDVREPAAFPAGPFEFLIECSAEPSVLAGVNDSPDYLMQANLMGAYHCLEKARAWKSRFLFLSTSRVYPLHRLESHPWKEQDTRFAWISSEGGISPAGVREDIDMNGARSLYGFTKYAAEQLIEEYRSAFGLRAVINRCGVLAGPWQFGKSDQGVASLWVLAHLFGRPLSYVGYGGLGKQVRDFLHIDDLCDLIVEQLSQFDGWDGWIGNVGGGKDNTGSLCELTSMCREITRQTVDIQSAPVNRPGDLRIFISDCTRLYERTSWRPKRNLQQIIEDISDWAGEHSEALKRI